ncbi:MAG: hypothetical protein ACJAW3_001027 [Lentimonas sp.]|jgi:hypothetical protein
MLKNKGHISLICILLLIPTLAHTNPENTNMDRNLYSDDFKIPRQKHKPDHFISNNLEINNSSNNQFSAQQDWSEGIHTFDKSSGKNFTLPYIQEDSDVDEFKKRNELIADMILEMPLEYKIRKGNFTSALSVTPSVFVPNENSIIGDGNINLGIKLEY